MTSSSSGQAPGPFPTPPLPPPWAKRLTTVGVTGTNGKTSTTSFIAAALASQHRPVARVTTLGMFLDDEKVELPAHYEGFLELMRRCLDRGGCFAAIELTSEALARGFATSWPCKVGVFTNLTHDHLDAHGSYEHYLASKAQLFVSLPPDGAAVLNGCDEACDLLAEVVPAGVRVLRYGVPSRGRVRQPLDVLASAVEPTFGGTLVSIEVSEAVNDAPDAVHTNAIGHVFAENALAAWLGAVALGVPERAAATAIGAAPAPAGRFEVVVAPTEDGTRAWCPHVVVDYAHTPDALGRTLSTARALCRGRLWLVFGAGGNRDNAKREPMGQAARVADRILLTSDNPRDEDPMEIARAIRRGLRGHPGVEVELDRATAIRRALKESRAGDMVVIAGKGHEVEQVVGRARRAFADGVIARRAIEAISRRRRRVS